MNKNYRFYLEDIAEAIEKIDKYVTDIDEVQFSRDSQLQDAVIRRLGIIGEAATKLPTDIRNQAPDIPWKSVIGFRNIIIHDYSNISMGDVWNVIQSELPKLKKSIAALLEKLPE